MPVRSESERVRQSNPRRVYPIDPGLVTACSARAGLGTGHLLETLVFLHLRRQSEDISYCRDEDGTEVDFVFEGPDGPALLQVSADITSSDTRKRELQALDAAMKAFGVAEATIVTLTAEETVTLKNGHARVVPF